MTRFCLHVLVLLPCCAVTSGLCCLLQLLLRLQRVEALVNQQQQQAAAKPGGVNLLLALAEITSTLSLPCSVITSSS